MLDAAPATLHQGKVAQSISRAQLVSQLRELGVQTGGVLLAHTAFAKLGPVEGGPRGLIEALRTVLGPEGTLVMPSMTGDADHAFDRRHTPRAGMDVVADTFWGMSGVLRSDSPQAFAALGPEAAEITAPHPVDVPHGADSPVGRVHALDGQVLLLGVGHDASTTVHLAENLAGVRYRRRSSATVVEQCCQRFGLMDPWLEARAAQCRGVVGHAQARLARSRDVVATALARLREQETVFLHPSGTCDQCDSARASLDRAAG